MALEDLFPDFAAHRAQNFAGITCPKPAIMIAITARTGSTFLCSALHEAGYSIEPNEVFNARGNDVFAHGPVGVECARRNVTDFASYLASLARDPDPAFIFKIGWHDAAQLAPALTSIFPDLRVIYLERRNIVAQAVSQFRAEMSGLWHDRAGDAPRRYDLAGKFDLTHICEIIQLMETEKQAWESWFTANQISPLRLEYRQIESDVREVLRRITEAMTLNLRLDMVSGAKIRKIADELSADWTERVQKHLYHLS